MASLLHRRRSTEVNKALHDVWPFPGLIHYIYIFGGSCPLTEFYQVQNSLCVQVLHSAILAALLHGTRAVGDSQTATRYKEWNYATFAPRHFRCRERKPPNGILAAGKFTANRTTKTNAFDYTFLSNHICQVSYTSALQLLRTAGRFFLHLYSAGRPSRGTNFRATSSSLLYSSF